MDDLQSFPSGIALPSQFSPTTPASLRAYARSCLDFLTSPLVSSLLNSHPNDIAVGGPRPEWLPWWQWAACGRAKWKLLVPGWPCDEDGTYTTAGIPLQLMQMFDVIDSLAIPRASGSTSTSHATQPLRGMSPKKAHEVAEMSAYIGLLSTQSISDIKHVVDVGAGQGYLSRALSEQPYAMNVLALDFSEVQIKGAKRRGKNIKRKKVKAQAKVAADADIVQPYADQPMDANSSAIPGTVTHEMIHINPQTLKASITSWISADSPLRLDPVPVLLVALHACGSLTPDILRCFLSCHEQPQNKWYPAGLVVVGCCYNLMSSESDFPMSTTVLDEMKRSRNHLILSYDHRSLAAQSPSQWTLDDSELAVRKVVYRAILEKQATLQSAKAAAANTNDNPDRLGKVGRLHNSAYTSLRVFISNFNARHGSRIAIPVWDDVQELASCIEVLHVLRCRIGPVVESLILADRWLHLAESIPEEEVLSVNLFDQDRGSVRNVALVVRPRSR